MEEGIELVMWYGDVDGVKKCGVFIVGGVMWCDVFIVGGVNVVWLGVVFNFWK